WQTMSARVIGARVGVALPAGRTDTISDRPEERAFTSAWSAKNITLGAFVTHKPGLPDSDPGGTAAQAEIAKFLEIRGLTQGGSITDPPNLNGSKGKQSPAKPNAEFKGMGLYRIWVVHSARVVLSAVGPADMKASDAEEFFKTVVAQQGGTPEDVGRIVLK